MAKKIEEIEAAIAQLPNEQLRRFREWYEKFDAEKWDEQIEKDAFAGKLDAMAEQALADHQAEKSRKL